MILLDTLLKECYALQWTGVEKLTSFIATVVG